MTEVEYILRKALTRLADGAPRSGLLLNRVHCELRRRRRRRAAATVPAVVAAVALVLAGAPLFVGGHSDTGGRSAFRSLPAQGWLVHSDLHLPTFPYKPTGSVPGVGEPTVLLIAGQPSLRHDTADPAAPLTVAVGASEPIGRPLTCPSPCQVRGQPARLATSEGLVSLSWRDVSGQWLEVRASPAIGTATILSYAAGLIREPIPLTMPFLFQRIPANLVIDNVLPSVITLRPVNIAPSPGFLGKLTVGLEDTHSWVRVGRLLEVGTHIGAMWTDNGYTMLRVDLGDGRSLAVQVPTDFAIRDTDLVSFAAGIRLTSAARVAKG